MEIQEKVGTRNFSAILELNGIVIVREDARELTRMTLNDALVTLAQEQNDEGILEATIGEALHALLRQYARTV
jgi:hypothetical protein